MASLNKVILMGNLVADPELKKTPSGLSVTSFRIAVARKLTKEQQQDPEATKADFIDIVAWRHNAEFVCNYFAKGKSIIVVGQIQVRSYKAQDGSKRYITEVVADEVSFGASAASENGTKQAPAMIPPSEFTEIDKDEDLPF